MEEIIPNWLDLVSTTIHSFDTTILMKGSTLAKLANLIAAAFGDLPINSAKYITSGDLYEIFPNGIFK
ncbi:MAG: hypothetical protein WAT26_05440 [Saprospiraceae bacterium]